MRPADGFGFITPPPLSAKGCGKAPTTESFNDWEGRGCHKIVPVLGGDGTKIPPTGDLFGQPPGEMSSIRGKLADHGEDHVVLSPEGVVLVTSSGTESSYPRPPQLLKHSTKFSKRNSR